MMLLGPLLGYPANHWLPPHWSVASAAMPFPEYESGTNPEYVVDDSGRFMYSHLGSQIDFAKRVRQQFWIGTGWSFDDMPPPITWREKFAAGPGTAPVGKSHFYPLTDGFGLVRADGETLAARYGGGYHVLLVSEPFVVKIGGKPALINRTTGYKPWLDFGIDVFTTGWEEPRDTDPFPAISRPKTAVPRPGVVYLLHRSAVAKINIGPIYRRDCSMVDGGSFWGAKHLYVASGRKMLAYQVSFGGRKPTERGIQRPGGPGNFSLGGGLGGMLADESMLMYQVGIWIFDTKSWKWHFYPDIIFYGRSYNGKYVAYGWYGERTMQLAKIAG